MSPVAFPTQNAVVLYGPKDLRLEERPQWPPRQGEAQVAVVATGLCGSDLHYYLHGRNGDFAVQAPMVLGHEAAGVITAVGPGVRHLVPGQRVAIEAGIMCNRCKYCTEGRYNLCKGLRFCSSAKTFPHLDGTLQNCMNHPAHVLHPLPDNVSFEQGALAEPLSVILHASRRSELKAGQTILVYGAGTIGLLACAVAKSMGASRICVVDINKDRLDFAVANGFAQSTHQLPMGARAKSTEEQLAKSRETAQTTLSNLNMQDGFDIVFECTGVEPCIQMSIHSAITGGKVMLIGMGSRNPTVPLSAAATREVDILGSFRYAHTYPQAIAMLASGKLKNIEKLITHRFSLEDSAKAFDLVARGSDAAGNMVLKVMVGGNKH